ncbi:putative CD81 protein [Penaeus vannamei]|uniref:Putative CD81 protein n=1 Tax=Penaeus vannamei TaxID=6689 RepID=A0A423T7P8_PENVA|nr:putative CD81 protein [Penaeus vannamei]
MMTSQAKHPPAPACASPPLSNLSSSSLLAFPFFRGLRLLRFLPLYFLSACPVFYSYPLSPPSAAPFSLPLSPASPSSSSSSSSFCPCPWSAPPQINTLCGTPSLSRVPSLPPPSLALSLSPSLTPFRLLSRLPSLPLCFPSLPSNFLPSTHGVITQTHVRPRSTQVLLWPLRPSAHTLDAHSPLFSPRQLLGGALLGTSLWMHLDGANMAPVTADLDGYNYVLYFLMAVGAFFALVLVLFAGQIAAGVWLKTNEERFTDLAKSSLAKSIQHDYGINKLKTQAFDVIQSELKCCGSEGPTDWAESRFNGADERGVLDIGIRGAIGAYKVPESCCNEKDKTLCEATRSLSIGAQITGSIYTEGCAKKMIQLIHSHSYEVLGVVAAIVLIEILAMIFSMVLCCAVRRIDHVKA